jgi:hypothetical protein
MFDHSKPGNNVSSHKKLSFSIPVGYLGLEMNKTHCGLLPALS